MYFQGTLVYCCGRIISSPTTTTTPSRFATPDKWRQTRCSVSSRSVPFLTVSETPVVYGQQVFLFWLRAIKKYLLKYRNLFYSTALHSAFVSQNTDSRPICAINVTRERSTVFDNTSHKLMNKMRMRTAVSSALHK